MAIYLAREYRADLVGVAAHRDNGRDRNFEEFGKVLRTMGGGIEANLLQDFEGHRVDIAGWLGAGAGDVDEVANGASEDSLREVTTAGVAGAENENEGLAHGMREEN
jgi:hypothetical protein